MVTLDDHKRPDGTIDWKAYHQAQKDQGERCYQCGLYMPIVLGMFGCGHPRRCFDCERLDKQGDVTHERFIRCPKCGKTESVHDYDSDLYEMMQEGEHDVTCHSCDHTYEVSTSVTYTFRSPERIDPPRKQPIKDGPK